MTDQLFVPTCARCGGFAHGLFVLEDGSQRGCCDPCSADTKFIDLVFGEGMYWVYGGGREPIVEARDTRLFGLAEGGDTDVDDDD